MCERMIISSLAGSRGAAAPREYRTLNRMLGKTGTGRRAVEMAGRETTKAQIFV